MVDLSVYQKLNEDNLVYDSMHRFDVYFVENNFDEVLLKYA